jgi:hypothetical protein
MSRFQDMSLQDIAAMSIQAARLRQHHWFVCAKSVHTAQTIARCPKERQRPGSFQSDW